MVGKIYKGYTTYLYMETTQTTTIEEDKTISTIKLKRSTIKRLNLWKIELDCGSFEELIDRILKIVPASELKNIKEENDN